MNKQLLKLVLEGKLKKDFLHLAKERKKAHIFMRFEDQKYWLTTGMNYRIEATDEDLTLLKSVMNNLKTIFIGYDK